MLTPELKVKVAAACRSYVGVKWIGQGRSHKGIDCIGVIVMSFRGAGLTVDEGVPNYRGIDSVRLVRLLLRHCERVDYLDGVEVGDVVVYGTKSEVHVAMIVDEKRPNAVHCPAYEEAVESRFDFKRAPIKGVYRWRS